MALDSIPDYLAIIGAVIILLPLLIFLGPAAAGVALLLATLWVVLVKGIPWAADFLKQRHSGAAAKKYEAMSGSDRGWDR
jgi:uncharacterized membrane protein HdeD (DUF308 family)